MWIGALRKYVICGILLIAVLPLSLASDSCITGVYSDKIQRIINSLNKAAKYLRTNIAFDNVESLVGFAVMRGVWCLQIFI